jgi:uncharacterized protein (TIGR02246 family)
MTDTQKELHPDEIAIRQLVSTWAEATEQGKLSVMLNLMADDVVFLVPGEKPIDKSAFIMGQQGLDQFDITIKSDIREVRLMSEEWAYCWNYLVVTINPKNGGGEMQRAGNVLSILNKQNGAWELKRDANMMTKV